MQLLKNLLELLSGDQVGCLSPASRHQEDHKTMSSLPEVRSRLRAGPGLWRVIVVLIRTGGRLRAPNAQHSAFRV